MKISSDQEQVYLKLLQEVGPLKKTSQEFEVSEHLVRKAKKSLYEKRLLAKPDAKKEQQIPENVQDRVLDFYQSDDFTRPCPGKKDFVCVPQWQKIPSIKAPCSTMLERALN